LSTKSRIFVGTCTSHYVGLGTGFAVVEIHAVINPNHLFDIRRFRLHIS